MNFILASLTAGAGFAVVFWSLGVANRWWLARRQQLAELSPDEKGAEDPAATNLDADTVHDLFQDLHGTASRITEGTVSPQTI